MRPDRLVVGEVRGAEVVDLLAALNTGHEGGCGTIHANSALDVPARVEALALAAGLAAAAAHSQLASAVDVVLHLGRGPRRAAPAPARWPCRCGTPRARRRWSPALDFDADGPCRPGRAPAPAGRRLVARPVTVTGGRRWPRWRRALWSPARRAGRPAAAGRRSARPARLAGCLGGGGRCGRAARSAGRRCWPACGRGAVAGAARLWRAPATPPGRGGGRRPGSWRRASCWPPSWPPASRPGRALDRAAVDWPRARAGGRGVPRSAPTCPRRSASSPPAPGPPTCGCVAAAWQVAHRTGHGLADAVDRVADGARGAPATRRVVAGELASARATARLVAGLPVLALADGLGRRAATRGASCSATRSAWPASRGGSAFGLAGLWWIEAIADAAWTAADDRAGSRSAAPPPRPCSCGAGPARGAATAAGRPRAAAPPDGLAAAAPRCSGRPARRRGAALFLGGRRASSAAVAAAVGCLGGAWAGPSRPACAGEREPVRRDLPPPGRPARPPRCAPGRRRGTALGAGVRGAARARRPTGSPASRARLALGVDPGAGLGGPGRRSELAPLGRALARAQATGAPVVAAVERLADDLARRARADGRGPGPRGRRARPRSRSGCACCRRSCCSGSCPLVAGLLVGLGL